MDFRILGHIEVSNEAGSVRLGGSKQRALLALLLLHANEPVSVDTLAEQLWSDDPPERAAKNLQVQISRLRRVLEGEHKPNGHDGAAGSIILTRPHSYLIRVEPGQLDLQRFGRLVDEGTKELAEEAPLVAEAKLLEALELWRGPPLADFSFDSFAQPAIAQMDELRLAAIELLGAAQLELGRDADVIGRLGTLVTQHPFQERLWEQLMLALYRSGRQADALAAYQDARHALVDELGIEPGADLRQLEARILAQDPSLELPKLPAPATQGPEAKPPLATTTPAARGGIGRRGLVVLAAVLALAGIAAAALLLLTRGSGKPPAAGDSVAVIDAKTGNLIGDIAVGAQPGALVAAASSIWVANVGDGSVSRINARTRRLVRTVSTGSGVAGVASEGDRVWTLDFGPPATVRAIDPVFNRPGEAVRIGGGALSGFADYGPAPVAVGAGSVWASTGDSTIVRVDPRTSAVKARINVGNDPSGIAVGEGAVWVGDGEDATVSRIDPGTNGVIATIPVQHGAGGIAVGGGAIWVAQTLEDSVARIDPSTNAVTNTIKVGRGPTGVAAAGGSVWVVNRHSGTLSRIDAAKGTVVSTTPIGQNPNSVAVADGHVWVSVERGSSAEPTGHPGGTVRVVAPRDFSSTDPSQYPDADPLKGNGAELEYATGATLLGYPDRPAPDGDRLQPEVARAMPTISPDGLTYTFRLRPGFRFSPPSNEPVTAEAYKHEIERVMDPKLQSYGAAFIGGIVGEKAYRSRRARHISGVIARGETLTIKLLHPVPDLAARLGNRAFAAVPPATPILAGGVDAIPSAGPYYIASHIPGQRLVLKRNPNYGGTRRRGPDEIDYSFGLSPAEGAAAVERGQADYTSVVPAPDLRRLARLYGPGSPAARAGRQRLFVNTRLELRYLVFNTRRPLFGAARVRRAVNYAIDRPALAGQGLPIGAGRPTDQTVPPGMPGFRDAQIYPLGGPDLAIAKRLASRHGGRGIMLTCNVEQCTKAAQVVQADLRPLGIFLEVHQLSISAMFDKLANPAEHWDIATAGWLADFADPSDFVNALFDSRNQGAGNYGHFDDPAWDRRLRAAAALTGNARLRAYGRLDAEITRGPAPIAPFSNSIASGLFSTRVGCQTYQPLFGIDLATLCVRR
jgi:YVTN family beta-propeller protein